MQLAASDLIDGIVKTLADNFEGCAVYTESAPQSLQLPCFFVFATRFSASQRICANDELEKQEIMFDIVYNVEDLSSFKTDSAKVVEKLFRVFRVIEMLTGDKVRIQRRRVRYTDDSMIFSMLIAVSLRYVDDPPELMQVLDLNTIRVKTE